MSSATSRKPRIIGIGNGDCGDDAAGPLVVRRLRELGMTDAQEVRHPLDLLECWDGADDVILVDAVITGAPPGTIHQWDALQLPPEAAGLRASSHSMSVGDAIRIAQATRRLPRALRVVAIEGACFTAGSSASTPVTRAVDEVARRCSRELDQP